jgi:TonB family protein
MDRPVSHFDIHGGSSYLAVVASLLTSPSADEAREAFRRALAAFPLAVAFQASLLAGIVLLSGHRPPLSPRAASQPVALRTLSTSAWAKNRGAPVAEKPAPLHPRGQVVDVADGNAQIPVESKYLAEMNNRVKEQTRAKEQTNKYSRATAKTMPNPMAQPSAKGRAAPQVETQSAPSFLASQLGRRQLSLLGDRPTPGLADAKPTEEPGPIGTAEGTQRTGSDTSEGGGAPNDALQDVKEGDGTFLNTREWRYAAFFNRVKQAVAAKWDPNGRLRAKNRNIGYVDRVTHLHVALRPDGSLADVFVAKSSGIDELDQEAIHAFEQAAPFANPPAALVEQGFIRFSFAFLLTNEMLNGGLPGFKRMGP